MPETITAIYEGGVLRPTTALPFAEGTLVRLTVDGSSNGPDASNEGSSVNAAELARKNDAAAFVQSLIDAKDRDELPEGYDFLEALNENRRLSGDYRMLFPPDQKGKTW
jgi:predicted DNA-binding antitoxin AbrB/MazE fold protein